MLDRKVIEDKMKERGFTVYATIGPNKIQFVSEHMYDPHYNDKTPPRQRKAIINVIVKLDTEEFACIYNAPNSINTLNSPLCGSVMKDDHFDRIVCKFEIQASWLDKMEW